MTEATLEGSILYDLDLNALNKKIKELEAENEALRKELKAREDTYPGKESVDIIKGGKKNG